jgi:Flp pilus assembly protein TadD
MSQFNLGHQWRQRPVLVILLLLSVTPQIYAAGKAGPPARTPEKQTASDAEFAAGTDREPTARTLYATAVLLRGQRRDAECEATLLSVIRQHPTFTPAYSQLAELRVLQRRIDEARSVLAAGLKAQPGDAVLLNNLGMCWVLETNYPQALNAFTKAAAKMPQNARYRCNMATALGMMGRFEEAFVLYRQALAPAQAEHNMGVLLRSRRSGGGASGATSTTSPPTTRPALSANAAVGAGKQLMRWTSE